MPTRPEKRITTSDPRQEKRDRVAFALANPDAVNLTNRDLARMCLVDESMIRRARKAMQKPKKNKPKAKKKKH